MSLFSREELSDNEKIDFIFKRLKAEQRMSQFKVFAMITAVICLYILVQFLAKPESEPIKKQMILFAQEKIATFVSPIVSGILDSVMADMMNNANTPSSTGGVNAIDRNTGIPQDSSANGNNPSTTVIPIRTRNIRPSETINPEELPTVQGVKITPEMLDAVQKSMKQ